MADSILDTVKKAISKREVKGQRTSRVGSGGASRRSRIDAAVDEAQMGRRRDNQSTDSSQ